jgi:hypothetical protein
MVHRLSRKARRIYEEAPLSRRKEFHRWKLSRLKDHFIRGRFIRLNFTGADKNASGSHS